MEPNRDPLAAWLALGREVLERYYPGAKYGMLLIHLGNDLPDVTFPVSPSGRGSLAPSPVPSSTH